MRTVAKIAAVLFGLFVVGILETVWPGWPGFPAHDPDPDRSILRGLIDLVYLAVAIGLATRSKRPRRNT